MNAIMKMRDDMDTMLAIEAACSYCNCIDSGINNKYY